MTETYGGSKRPSFIIGNMKENVATNLLERYDAIGMGFDSDLAQKLMDTEWPDIIEVYSLDELSYVLGRMIDQPMGNYSFDDLKDKWAVDISGAIKRYSSLARSIITKGVKDDAGAYLNDYFNFSKIWIERAVLEEVCCAMGAYDHDGDILAREKFFLKLAAESMFDLPKKVSL